MVSVRRESYWKNLSFRVRYECGPDRRFTSILRSERFDLKAMGSREDLESRESWAPRWLNRNMGDLQVVEPLEIANSTIAVDFCLSRGPCFAIVNWKSGASYMSVSTRPSPPYRDWIPGRAPPADFGRLVFESRMHRRCLFLPEIETKRVKPKTAII